MSIAISSMQMQTNKNISEISKAFRFVPYCNAPNFNVIAQIVSAF